MVEAFACMCVLDQGGIDVDQDMELAPSSLLQERLKIRISLLFKATCYVYVSVCHEEYCRGGNQLAVLDHGTWPVALLASYRPS